ncbi:MAG: site-2 protease family protein [Dehalococcoidia bacterium]
MLLRYLGVLADAPLAYLMLVGAFVFSMLVGLTFHEFSHAYVANGLGDHTAARRGRLSLNPMAHFDPIGSTMILFIGFGWAKPVPVNPYVTANPKRTMALTALAGPASNLVVAGLAAVPIKAGLVPFFHPFISPSIASFAAEIWAASPENLIGLFLGTVVLLNVLLAVFNFLPLAPLDGFNVAVGLLPDDLSRTLQSYAAWGPGILLLLIFMPFLSNGQFNPLFDVMGPAIDFFLRVFTGDAGQVTVV